MTDKLDINVPKSVLSTLKDAGLTIVPTKVLEKVRDELAPCDHPDWSGVGSNLWHCDQCNIYWERGESVPELTSEAYELISELLDDRGN